MSKLCDQVIEVVKGLFPEMNLITEHHVKFRGVALFLDIFLPQIDLVIEVHGRQHDQFVAHFHKDESDFKQSRFRDRLKEEWVDLNGLSMVVLREADLPVTPESLLEHIDNAISS